MPRMPGPTRRDAAVWGLAVAVAVVLTLVASAAGARLGSALTAGVIGLVVTVIAMLLLDTRR